MFAKVLVANRGEIAVRIIRSLKELGIKTVAIYSTVDRNSLHVQLADEAVCVGSEHPQDSYLNMQNILAAAIGTGAEAIHPGFGFLAENSQFVEMCEACQITFIGPRSETIELMGNKANARMQMLQSGVPVIPGSQGYLTDIAHAKAVAKEVGYPILLKAVAGGGGRGIRRVANENELTLAYEKARSEAQSAFGDDRMYLEKVLENVKHIEVQFFCDNAGHRVYFPERDCSIQRNKQKMIEESPCQFLTQAERDQLGAITLKAAETLDYQNTGTLEFLMDQDHNFYFLEMNTRIQVEHTVTEMVTGIDLVKLQVKVAAGEDLPFQQEDIKILGHAIECRINAENPVRDFMPSTGTIDYLYLPVGNLGMRIDTDLYAGGQITPYYDAMIAKVIALGEDRPAAIEKVKRLLAELVIKGIDTNQKFHLGVLNNPDFLAGNVSTDYLEKEFLTKWKRRESDATI
ncbi:acetyl-CoA carboxylase biotin carboxylase subunit [Ligilactobacillus ceti]|uniref:Biotin carboxylase n=1 Tax=Ligilactobacillus ceti DSM 22408 TaxID=1122146 RepID=A0A0R2KI26_9LACO|nr:acetyl-CoA carboxylase biotin carboxylase subunit [Ligilactobacillus ceti]KRN89040.1 acetyl-CoA carboxylase, biotin carboxylase [Ligilactobacillus ceti DSM 22408]